MSKQREELELAIHLAESDTITRVLAQFKELLGVSDQLASKKLVPLVEQSTVSALDALNKRIADLIDQLGKVKTIGGTEKLKKEYDDLATAVAKILANVNGFTEAVKKEDAALGGLNQNLSDLKAKKLDVDTVIKRLIRSNQQESQEFIKLNQASVNLGVAIKGVSDEKKKLTGDTERQTKADQAAAGSVDQLRLKLTQLQKTYDSLSASERNSATGKALLTQIQQVDKDHKAIKASTGRFQDNVGNYPGSAIDVNKLNDVTGALNFFRNGLGDLSGPIEKAVNALVLLNGTLLKTEEAKKAAVAINEVTAATNETTVATEALTTAQTQATAGAEELGAASAASLGPIALIIAGITAAFTFLYSQTQAGSRAISKGFEEAKGVIQGFYGFLNSNDPGKIIKGAQLGKEVGELKNKLKDFLQSFAKDQAAANAIAEKANAIASDGNTGYDVRIQKVKDFIEQQAISNEKAIQNANLLNDIAQKQLEKAIRTGNKFDEEAKAASEALATLTAAQTKADLDRRNGLERQNQLEQESILNSKENLEFLARETGVQQQANEVLNNTANGYEKKKKAAEESGNAGIAIARRQLDEIIQQQNKLDAFGRTLSDADKKAINLDQQQINLSVKRIEAENAVKQATLNSIAIQEENEAVFYRARITLLTSFVNEQYEVLQKAINNQDKPIMARQRALDELFVQNGLVLRDLSQNFRDYLTELAKIEGKTEDTVPSLDKIQQSFEEISKIKFAPDFSKALIETFGQNQKITTKAGELIDLYKKKLEEAKDEQLKFILSSKEFFEKAFRQTEELLNNNTTIYDKQLGSFKDFNDALLEIQSDQAKKRIALQLEADLKILDNQIRIAKDTSAADKLRQQRIEKEKAAAEQIRLVDVDTAQKREQRREKESALELSNDKLKDAQHVKFLQSREFQDELATRNDTQRRIEAAQKELQDLKTLGQEGTDGYIDLQKKISDLEIQLFNQNEAIRNKLVDRAKEAADTLTSGVADGFKQQSSLISGQLEDNARHIQEQALLASKGLNNTLGADEAQRRELEKKKAEDDKNAIKAEKLKTFFDLFASYAKDNPDTAAAKALVQIELADIITGKFEDGSTEFTIGETLARKGIGGSVDHSGIISGRRHSGGGVIIEAESDEGMFSGKEMRNMGRSNFLNLKAMARQGALADNFFAQENERLQGLMIVNNSDNKTNEVVSKLDSVEKAIRSIPVSTTNLDNLGNAVTTIIKDNHKKTIINKRKRFG